MKTKQLIEKAVSKSTALMFGLFTAIGGCVAGFGLWGALNREPALAIMFLVGGVIVVVGEVAIMETAK